MTDRLRDERGETLIESLVSIGIIGTVLIALIGAVMLGGSMTTILRAQTDSQVAGRSLVDAVSAYKIPKGTPFIANGACNPSILTPLQRIVSQAYSSSASQVTQPSAPTYWLVMVSADAQGNTSTTEYNCASSLSGHPADGEDPVAFKVKMPVQAEAHSAVQQADGSVKRQSAVFAPTLNAYVFPAL